MPKSALPRRALLGAVGASAAGIYATSHAVANPASTAEIYDTSTRVAVEAERIPPVVQLVRTGGYASVGDGGGASYVRLPDAPDTPDEWHVRSADGAWWELADDLVSVKALGAKGDFDVSSGEGADDTEAFQAATRLDRTIYVPGTAHTYKVTKAIRLGRDGACWYGDGYRSRITLFSIPDGVGQLLGIGGDAPATPDGPPQRFTSGVHVSGLHLDTQDGKNNNGLGGSFCRDITVENMFFSNVGRKAVTFQYHVHNVQCRNIKVFQASTEPGSTHPAISVEGLTEGVDLSYYPGGTDHTADLGGKDISNITFRDVSIESSGYNYVVVSNAHGVGFTDFQIGDATGGGSFIIFIRKVRDSYVRRIRGGDSERRFIFFDKDVEGCAVEDFRFGSTNGGGGDGRAIQCAGSHNRFENGSFRHANPATLEAVFVAGADVTLAGLRVLECTSTFVVNAPPAGERLTMCRCTITASAASAFRVKGAGAFIEGNRFFVAGAPATGRFEGVGNHCIGNYFEGTGTGRLVVSPQASVIATMNTFGEGSTIDFQGGSVYASAAFSNLGLVGGHANQLPLDSRAIRADSQGVLRVKEMPFTSDLDGTVVGSQG